ncbi:hypothetical protein N0V90_003863 [Kalmusia sp. IMI 367209]|nr:hypothetical protein N0V90_003863 [Kalmusia sp. IMI 367209]
MEATNQHSDRDIVEHTIADTKDNKLENTILSVAQVSSESSPAISPDVVVIPVQGEPLPLGIPLQQGWEQRRIHRWKSPVLMVAFFLIGLAMSLAHCIFYPSLNGKIVGDPDIQEEKIRGLLLPPFFTPATLFVYQSSHVEQINTLMPFPHIGNSTPSVGTAYSYSPPARRGRTQYVDDASRIFTGPRTIISLIASATASLGEILPIKLPYTNSSHEIEFYAPIVQCLDANASTSELIDYFRKQDMSAGDGVVVETDNVYYAFVPSFNSTGDLIPVSTVRLQTPSNATNELWMTFLRPIIRSGARETQRKFQVCSLHNATYHLRIERDHGIQNITKSYIINEQIPYPRDNTSSISNMAQHAYTAVMWALCDQLVGKFSWYNNTAFDSNSSLSTPSGAAQFGVLQSPIQRTSLLGSLDLDAFFDLDESRKLYKMPEGNGSLSEQRLMDKNMARNRTLDVLIEELSFNISVGLMWDPLLTKYVPTNVTTPVNRYAYKAYGLFLPYALANVFSLLIITIGIYSYVRDGVMAEKKFQDIVSAAEDPEIVHVIRNRKRSVTAIMRNEKLVLQAGNSLDGNNNVEWFSRSFRFWNGWRRNKNRTGQ